MHWILQGDIFGFPFEKEIAIGIPIDLSVFFTFTVALGVQPKVCMPFNLGLMAGQGGMWAWIIADRYYPLIDQIRGKADAVGQKLCDVIETLQTDQKPPCPEGTVRCGDSCMDQETYEKMMQLCAIPGIGCPCND